MFLQIKGLSVVYMTGTPFEARALDCVDFELTEGEMVGLVGSTGSGKSTLVQALNGLLDPSEGDIVYRDDVDRKALHRRIGLVFQQPEDQLFEKTVHEDVGFGPGQLGVDSQELVGRIRRALEGVGLDPDRYWERSPFDLSGGEKRRVAIAGILAMEPELLVLDEPTAGLDAAGRRRLLDNLKALHADRGLTTIVVSHDMDLLAELATRLVVLHEGRIVASGSPVEIFCRDDVLEATGLEAPFAIRLLKALRSKGLQVNERLVRLDEALAEIRRALRKA